MSRYIYDEVKNDFLEEGLEIKPWFIIQCMAKATHEMGYKAPGEVPDELFENLKQGTKMKIRRYITGIGTGLGWLESLRKLRN